jgi:acyl-CoA thioesterase-1
VAGIPSLNQSDGIHPTPEGHRIMARSVWSVLGPVIEDLEAQQ